MANFEEAGISATKGLLTSPYFNFPLYQMFSLGSVTIDLALPSLPHIN